MNDKQKTLAAVTIILGALVLFVVFLGALLNHRSVVSPVPEESAIRIIFITPTPTELPTPTGQASPTPTKKAVR